MKRIILILLITLTANCAANDYYFQLVHKYNSEYYLYYTIVWFYEKAEKKYIIAKDPNIKFNVTKDSMKNIFIAKSKYLKLDSNVVNKYKNNNLYIYLQSFLSDENGEHYEFLDTLDIPYEARDTIVIESEIPDK